MAEQDSTIRFRLNGEVSTFDVNRLMFAEVREIERVTGESLKQNMKLLKEGWIGPMQSLVWTAYRRTNPGAKYSDYDNVAISDVEFLDENEIPITADPESEAAAEGAAPFGGVDEPSS